MDWFNATSEKKLSKLESTENLIKHNLDFPAKQHIAILQCRENIDQTPNDATSI